MFFKNLNHQNFKKDLDLFYLFIYVHFFHLFFITFNNFIKNHIELFPNLEKIFNNILNFSILFILIYLFLKFIFKNFYRKIILILLYLILFLNSIDLFLYINFSVQLTPELLYIFFETNQNEAKEFIQSFLNINFLVILYYFIFGLSLIKIIKKLNLLKVIFSFITISFIFIFTLDINGNNTLRKKHIFKNIYYSYSRYTKEMKDLNYFLNNFESLTKDLKVTSMDNNSATYIFIIGESFTKHHSSLYGYPRETNPYMNSLKKKGELVIFNDVVSPHHFTRETLKKLVTTYAHDSQNNFENSINIIDIMKKAGFKTYWISNQENFTFRGAGLSAIASRADSTTFTEEYFIQDRNEKIYDGYVLPLLKQAIDDTSASKKFIIIHLFGSHVSYQARYPREFLTFSLNEIPSFFNSFQKKNKEIVNHYDNSLVYNDYIIKSIIENSKIKNTNSFILYLSDHGQTLFEDINGIASPIPSKTLRSVEIPLIFWASNEYKKLHPKIIENINISLDNPYSSEDIIYTLIELSNLEYSKHIPEKSIINPLFLPKKRTISSEGEIYENLKNKF